MKKVILIAFVCLPFLSIWGQNYGDYKLYADFDFENGAVADKLGNANTSVLNGAKIVADPQRSSDVLYFPANQKGCLKFNESPIKDQMTISFWFKREDSDPNINWRMMFSFTADDNSKVYFTPKTTWSEHSYLVYDNQAYDVYKSVAGKAVVNNQWTHYAIVFADNNLLIYQDGELSNKITMVTKLSDVNTNKWFFGNHPDLNFAMEGKIDDLKIFHSALATNQILELKNSNIIPDAIDDVLPFAWIPFNGNIVDKMENISPVATSVNYANDEIGDKCALFTINSSVLFNKGSIGSGKFSIPFLLRKETFSDVDNGRYILKFNAENGDFIGLQVVRANENNGLQLVRKTGEIITVEGVLNRYLKTGEWNSIVFVQTFSNVGTPAIRVYVNGASGLLKTNINIHSLDFTDWTLGTTNDESLDGLYDELKIYQRELSSSDISMYHKSMTEPVTYTADVSAKYQTICNFGSSDGWNAQPVGLYLTESKKEQLAELLFSREVDADGTPKGIGLSAWRFNIGAGTYEQGENSRIETPERRSECFLKTDGTYDWTKQAGQRYFLEKAAKKYNVPDIIGWQNSPPVKYTVRGLGFREFGDEMKTILKKEHFNDFGKFLADVILHFKEEGINFKYISPLNEPQWDWAATSAGAKVSQEGTPWTNQEIHDVLESISDQFTSKNITTKLFVTEAGSINCILQGTKVAYNQLNHLWKNTSPMFIGGIPALSDIVSSHSYWDDADANDIVTKRQTLRDRMKELNPDYQFWQTEYSFLGTGYKFGHPSDRLLTPMESGISLARIIHNDLVNADATGWQWWTTFEFERKLSGEDRFALIPITINKANTDGVFRTTKLLYTLGNYSRFVRPGMKRIDINGADSKTEIEAVTTQMISAYIDETSNEMVIVAVNASAQDCGIRLDVANLPSGYSISEFTPYVTTNSDGDNLKKYPDVSTGENFILPGTSVVTFVSKTTFGSGLDNNSSKDNEFSIYPNPAKDATTVSFNSDISPVSMYITNMTGKLIERISLPGTDKSYTLHTRKYPNGIYLVTVDFGSFSKTLKLIVQ